MGVRMGGIKVCYPIEVSTASPSKGRRESRRQKLCQISGNVTVDFGPVERAVRASPGSSFVGFGATDNGINHRKKKIRTRKRWCRRDDGTR